MFINKVFHKNVENFTTGQNEKKAWKQAVFQKIAVKIIPDFSTKLGGKKSGGAAVKQSV